MWQYNYIPSSDDIMHYGIPGMRWGHRKAKAQAISRYRNEYNKKQAGKSSLSKAYSKITGADKIYAEARYNMSKSKAAALKSSNKSTKKPISNNTAHKDLKKATKSGQKKTKKVLSKNSGKAVKAIGKSANLGLSMVQSLYNISDTGFENRQMQSYVNLASQMSPEYRRRFMYD